MNSFESLCTLASQENWCWKLFCTTCGHLHFRYAFQELSTGKSPDDHDWVVHSRTTHYSKLIGSMPRGYTSNQKKKVLSICANADISLIDSSCQFPDWLGYMGLVLEDLYINSIDYRETSVSWARQLKDMVPSDSEISSRFNDIINNEDSFLNIKDLEHCESYLWDHKNRGS